MNNVTAVTVQHTDKKVKAMFYFHVRNISMPMLMRHQRLLKTLPILVHQFSFEAFLPPSEHDTPWKGWHKQRLCQSSYRHSADNHHHGLQRRKRCPCFSFAHNQESLGMAPLCWFGNPYRFCQAKSFSCFKPNALQNQLSRSPLRCFQ